MSGTERPNEEASRNAATRAMERVLQAQEASHEAIENARRQAEALIVAAREEARLIAARTDRRISAIQKRRASYLKKESASLLRKERLIAERARTERRPVDLSTIAQRLARQLIASEVLEP